MYDIVIIGSGPAGLSAAIYAQRENLKAVVVEKEFMGTGQIAESERVDNYPGLYGETGFDLGEKFRTHAKKLGLIHMDTGALYRGVTYFAIKECSDENEKIDLEKLFKNLLRFSGVWVMKHFQAGRKLLLHKVSNLTPF